MPRSASIEFVPTKEVDEAGLKFGGEPYGLPAALWPKSKSTGEPMQFVCQIPFGPDLFPGVREAVAYLFMTSGGDGQDTWVPDGGENAVIIVPREGLSGSLTVGDAPRLCRMVKKWWSRRLLPQTCIFSGKVTLSEDPEFMPEERLWKLPEAEAAAYREGLQGNKIGGTPVFIQSDELPFAGSWHLLLQLDSTAVPFWINFGDAGVGYAFINGNGTEGKFLWQCC
jgi:uncharacterized protein YwqG